MRRAPGRRSRGAALHYQPMARLRTHQRMFDWLDDQLARTRTSAVDPEHRAGATGT